MSEKKRGRLSKDEEQTILNNIDSKSDEEIAAMINRDPIVVTKFRAQSPIVKVNESYNDLISQLKMKFFWKEIQSQLLNEDEEIYFQNHWASLMQQFAAQGVLATDELMIRDLIMVDINLNRSSRSKRSASMELADLEFQTDQIYADTVDDPTNRAMQLAPIATRMNALRTALKSLSDEFKVLQDKKDKKLEQLKATREMRLEKVEKSGHSFFDLVKMLDNPDMRENEGRLNELYKISAQMARLQFEKYHKYENGKLDRPFLTPEAEENDEVAP